MSGSALLAALAAVAAPAMPALPGPEPSSVASAIEMAVTEIEDSDEQALPSSFAPELDEDDGQGAELRLRLLRLKLRVPI